MKKDTLVELKKLTLSAQVDWLIKNQEKAEEMAAFTKMYSGLKTSLGKVATDEAKRLKSATDEPYEVKGRLGVATFTACAKTQVLLISDVGELIKKLGLKNCVEAVSVSAAKLIKVLGTEKAKKYVKAEDGDRKFKTLTPK